MVLALAWMLAASWPTIAGSAAPTATTLAVTSGGSAMTSVAAGAVVTLTATVAAGATPATTGQVKFCDATAKYCEDIHIVGTAQLTGAGTAVFKFRPGAGSHSYKAVFAGTNSYSGSASAAAALTVTVSGPARSFTTMTATAGTGSNNYNLSASVFGNGNAAPTGTVSFLDTANSDALLGTATLGAGTAGFSIFNVSSPTTGTAPDSVAVGDFNGDGIPDLAVANEDSSTVTILLGNGDGTFTPTATSPATGGGPVSVAVGDFNGDGIPDLALANLFSNGVTVLLAENQMASTAATPVSLSPGDTHVVVANYAGDNNYSSSSSSATTLSEGSVSTTLSLSVTASTAAQPVTLTATLAPYSAQGYSTDGQTVTFSGGETGVVLGTATLKGGVATLTLTSLPGGSYTASASFGGYAVFALSTASTQFTLATVPTTVTLNANLSASIVGQPVTLTATLSPYTINGHSSNGDSITFQAQPPDRYKPPFVVGTAMLSGGVATLNAPSISAGTYTLSAVYGQDSYLAGSSSNGLPWTVSQVQPTLTLSASPLSSSYGQPVTLTATLSSTNTYTAPASGTVTFAHNYSTGSQDLGTATVSSGVASVTVSSLLAGVDDLLAFYSGDSGNSMPIRIRSRKSWQRPDRHHRL